jgi:hypothetical protein
LLLLFTSFSQKMILIATDHLTIVETVTNCEHLFFVVLIHVQVWVRRWWRRILLRGVKIIDPFLRRKFFLSFFHLRRFLMNCKIVFMVHNLICDLNLFFILNNFKQKFFLVSCFLEELFAWTE